MSWLDRWLKLEREPDAWLAFRERCVDSNGRRREAALRQLAQLPAEFHGRALPLVLVRLNDWVPQVRRAAIDALSLLLRDDLEPAWIEALPAVVRLMTGSRWTGDGSVVRDDIEQFLLSVPSRRIALLASASSLGPAVRRWLVWQSWHHGTAEERKDALVQALAGSDVRMALQACAALQALDPDWYALTGVREALARTPFPRLRLSALRQALARGHVLAGDEALGIAFSRHGGTRSWLLFHADAALKQRVLGRAEAVLDEAGPAGVRLVALQLLRELGATTLPARLTGIRADPVVRLREMAYAISLASAAEAEGTVLALQALADASPRVQRVALRALRQGRVTLTVRELLDLVRR